MKEYTRLWHTHVVFLCFREISRGPISSKFPIPVEDCPGPPCKERTQTFRLFYVSFQKIIKFIKDYKICQSIDCLRSCAMSAVFQLSEREIMLVLFSGQLVKGVSTHLKPKYQRCLQRASWRCRVIQPIKKMCSRTNSDVIPLFCVSSGLNTAILYK